MTTSIQFDPENISIALFNLLLTANFTFNGSDRRGQITQNIDTANMPYLSLIETGGRQVESQAQGLEKWILDYTVLVYFQPDATPTSIPATQINAAWKALVEIMRSVPFAQRQTLGGIVDNAWIEGEIEIGTGILGQYAILALPIKVDCGI